MEGCMHAPIEPASNWIGGFVPHAFATAAAQAAVPVARLMRRWIYFNER